MDLKVLFRHCRLSLLALLFFVAACSTPESRNNRSFNFQQDTFAYANELAWEYDFDANGKWTGRKKNPPPDYSLHCFVLAKSAKQFFNHARFDPSLSKADAAEYRRLILQVRRRSPREISAPENKVVIPGYKHLKKFSQDWGDLLKQANGGAWQSYVQRGHWRMVFPFSNRKLEKMAGVISKEIANQRPSVVHVVQFPELSINHAVLVFELHDLGTQIEMDVYDPNDPETPLKMIYLKQERRFLFPRTKYFPGGEVDAYPVYHSAFY